MSAMSDPKKYRELNQPFADEEKAKAAIEAFEAEVRAARDRHGLPDVYLVFRVLTNSPDGEAELYGTMHCGDSSRSAVMTAYAAGLEQERLLSALASLRRGKVK